MKEREKERDLTLEEEGKGKCDEGDGWIEVIERGEDKK